ncbi:hypothetical protein [Halobellus sp. EA9]|uniref:hypothetical protein n=1 Tax=Halobellus sp. EA9 TaxID=3421647 RepID=UPI003EB6A90A
MSDRQSVSLPEDTIQKVKHRLQYTTFDSVDEYVLFVMEEVLYRVEDQGAVEQTEHIDETQVKNRLESLGYLNE